MPGLPWLAITAGSVSSRAVKGHGPLRQNVTSTTARQFMRMRAAALRRAQCWMNGIGSMAPAYASRRIDD